MVTVAYYLTRMIKKSLLDSFFKFESLKYNQINKFKINSKKSSRNFSIFKHYNDLSLILKKYD